MTQLYRNRVSAQYNKLRSALQDLEELKYSAYCDIAKYRYRCDEYDEAEDMIDNLSEARRNIEGAMDCLRDIMGDYKICQTKQSK